MSHGFKLGHTPRPQEDREQDIDKHIKGSTTEELRDLLEPQKLPTSGVQRRGGGSPRAALLLAGRGGGIFEGDNQKNSIPKEMPNSRKSGVGQGSKSVKKIEPRVPLGTCTSLRPTESFLSLRY